VDQQKEGKSKMCLVQKLKFCKNEVDKWNILETYLYPRISFLGI